MQPSADTLVAWLLLYDTQSLLSLNRVLLFVCLQKTIRDWEILTLLNYEWLEEMFFEWSKAKDKWDFILPLDIISMEKELSTKSMITISNKYLLSNLIWIVVIDLSMLKEPTATHFGHREFTRCSKIGETKLRKEFSQSTKKNIIGRHLVNLWCYLYIYAFRLTFDIIQFLSSWGLNLVLYTVQTSFA